MLITSVKVRDTYHSLTGVRALAKLCRKRYCRSLHVQIHALTQQRALQKEVRECNIFHKPSLLSQRRPVRRRNATQQRCKPVRERVLGSEGSTRVTNLAVRMFTTSLTFL
jgi:hypothetical protein